MINFKVLELSNIFVIYLSIYLSTFFYCFFLNNGEIVCKTGFSSLGLGTCPWERRLWIQTSFTPLKISLVSYCLSCERVEWIYINRVKSLRSWILHNRWCRKKWNQWREFKFWRSLFLFHLVQVLFRKVGDSSKRRPEGSIFISYNTEA